MHQGITLSKLRARNIKDRLFIVDMKNTSFNNLIVNINYTSVPKLLSYVMLQTDYRVDIDDWSVIPGFRYMRQFDRGAGSFSGANLRGLIQGYQNPNSLDATLYGARVDMINDVFKLRFGYTKIKQTSLHHGGDFLQEASREQCLSITGMPILRVI